MDSVVVIWVGDTGACAKNNAFSKLPKRRTKLKSRQYCNVGSVSIMFKVRNDKYK